MVRRSGQADAALLGEALVVDFVTTLYADAAISIVAAPESGRVSICRNR